MTESVLSRRSANPGVRLVVSKSQTRVSESRGCVFFSSPPERRGTPVRVMYGTAPCRVVWVSPGRGGEGEGRPG